MTTNYKIAVEPDAFIRMITHVLKYGNEALEESVEVMGVCIGKITEEENLIELVNILPIQHGIQVSTGFTREDIELFSQLDKEYQEKGLGIIGWYTSRPGWGLDFTDITIQNHKFFQTDKNPHGFIIIFDHSLLGDQVEDLGFKVYTLKDYKKSNEYLSVTCEIGKPNTLGFFKWVQKFVEDSQRLSPVLIKELKDQSLKELQEIPQSKEDLVSESITDYSAEVEQVFSGFRNGISTLNETINEPYTDYFKNWVGDLTHGTLKGMEYLSGSLNQLKNTVTDGLRDVQKFFNTTFSEISQLFKKNITEYINNRVQGEQELKVEISSIIDKMIEELKENLDKQIEDGFNLIEEKLNVIQANLESNNDFRSKLTELTSEISTLVANSEEEIKALKTNLEQDIENIVAPIKAQFEEKFDELDSELNPTKENYSEISSLLEKLQKLLTEFRNI
jgi:proteasome lid subunit RPN8/RPN11/F0F1-type ATP synthase membrane subunit b/b'